MARSVLIAILRLAWHAVRLPILAVLIVLEPIVSTVLLLASVLGIVTALLFELAGPAETFPFWTMMAVWTGVALTLFLYYGLIRLLSLH